MPPYRVNIPLLNDIRNEEAQAWDYHLNAACYLGNFLENDQQFRNTRLCTQLNELILYWNAEPNIRPQDNENRFIHLVIIYGVVGRALFHLNQPIVRGQLGAELLRYANRPEELIGNYFLFYLAGHLAIRGFAVDFVQETVSPTPDLKISLLAETYFIEANARQPRRIIDSQDRLRMQIKALIEEKRVKFKDSQYRPGIIAGEVSPLIQLFGPDGEQHSLTLKAETMERLPSGTILYHLDRDPDWHTYPQNMGGAFQFLIEEYSLQDSDDRVAGVFLAIALQSVTANIDRPHHRVQCGSTWKLRDSER